MSASVATLVGSRVAGSGSGSGSTSSSSSRSGRSAALSAAAAALAAAGAAAGATVAASSGDSSKGPAAGSHGGVTGERVFEPPRLVSGLPEFTEEEVSRHKGPVYWVSFGAGVFDVTEFVEKHPGGAARLKMAAGGALEPFWGMYAQHRTPEVLDILSQYRIGNLRATPGRKVASNDPYASDPHRHPVLKINSQAPFNAEPPVSILADSFITPTDLFFVRNHLPVPTVSLADYKLEVRGENGAVAHFTLDDLKKRFPHRTMTSALMCTGNRREEFNAIRPVKGLRWTGGAISNATWTGVYLRDVLAAVGVTHESADTQHVIFDGLDADLEKHVYSASIPAYKALSSDADVLLAWDMNGQPLSRDHGYPLRVVVPGVAGARNVKWLSKIAASPKESDSHWQQGDYKSFSPSIDWHNVDWSKSVAVQDLPVQSMMCTPSAGDTVMAEADEHDPSKLYLPVTGYAWSGGGRAIIRVDVSADGGATWTDATLQVDESQPLHKRWAWTLWRARVPISAAAAGKPVTIMCKAIDAHYNVQPERAEPIWNLRGVLANSWHHVTVNVEP